MRVILALLLTIFTIGPVHSQGGMGPGPGTAHSVSAATTTWNSAAKSAKLTLSGSDLIETYTDVSDSTYEAVKAIASHSTGLYFCQFVLNENTGGLAQVGIGNAGASVNNYTGSDTNSVGWFAGNGNVYSGGGGIASIQTATAGDTLSMAVNLTTMRIWFRTNTGNWNNDVSADPATNTNGIDISGLAVGPYFPTASNYRTNNQITANFGGSAYSPAAPSGFGNW